MPSEKGLEILNLNLHAPQSPQSPQSPHEPHEPHKPYPPQSLLALIVREMPLGMP